MTEQLCFPKLLKAANDSNEAHVKPIALKDVGQFDKAKASARVLWDAYEKLCKADALMPPTVAFCLDREGRKQKEIDEISTLSGGRMKFLPRRNYESFLLHPKAISEVLSQIPFDEPVDISEARIAHILSELGTDKNFHAAKYWKGDVYDASLLRAIFAKVAPGKAVYQKTAHSVYLTEWLIANDPNHIKELIEFVSLSTKTNSPEYTKS
jgi:hypothetical protein